MPRTKTSGPKRNIWKDPSPYGTYEGLSGNPDAWKAAFEFAFYSRDKALGILKNILETPYQILGVSKDATQEIIQSAYRKLAMLHHPDKGGDRVEFEKVTAAYSLLKS